VSLDADKALALALTPVSRETEKRLDSFVALLIESQAKFNLIASSTIPVIWTRHISDSLQLLEYAPEAKFWADFGSGAGFPGVVIACALAQKPGALVHLVESVGKKANFLREAVKAIEIPATVNQIRAENFGDSCGDKVDVVTARALAPLKTLCDLAFPLIAKGAVGLFNKGQDVDAELTEAAKYWTVAAEKLPSKTSPQGCILKVSSLEPRKSGRTGR